MRRPVRSRLLLSAWLAALCAAAWLLAPASAGAISSSACNQRAQGRQARPAQLSSAPKRKRWSASSRASAALHLRFVEAPTDPTGTQTASSMSPRTQPVKVAIRDDAWQCRSTYH